MARFKLFLKQGIGYLALNSTDGGFDVGKWLKRELKYLNVQHTDKCCPVAIDATATIEVEDLSNGLITSTSAAATSITLPPASDFKAVRGVIKYFTVDNSAGANTVTVVVNTGITAQSVITGGTTLTVASGAVGRFQLYFVNETTAKLSRLV